MKKYFVLFTMLFLTAYAWADGGRLQFRKPAGPFMVTLFTTPDPLTPGPADFSVVIEQPGIPGVVGDAKVTFVLTPVDGKGKAITLHATHAQATTRFLQAANFTLPRQGVWKIAIQVEDRGTVSACSSFFRVEPPNLITDEAVWQIAVVPLLVLLFLLHQWRKRSVARQRRQARIAARQP